MRQMSGVLLVAATTIAAAAAFGQADSDLAVHISAQQTCVVGTLEVPCNAVGAKLLDQGTPRDAHIHLLSGTDSSYEAISAALTSLRDAGFTLKVGYVNVVTDSAPGATQTDSTATSTMMILQNFPFPFVDRNLAAQIGRSVIAAKYPFAVLSRNLPEVTDQGTLGWLRLRSVGGRRQRNYTEVSSRSRSQSERKTQRLRTYFLTVLVATPLLRRSGDKWNRIRVARDVTQIKLEQPLLSSMYRRDPRQGARTPSVGSMMGMLQRPYSWHSWPPSMGRQRPAGSDGREGRVAQDNNGNVYKVSVYN